MKHFMNNLFQKLAGASLAATAWMATAAHAVNDLPGGPAVNQLNLPPPVTRIAAEQQAAVLSARFEAMTDRTTRAEARVEGLEKQIQQAGQELSSARVQVQAQQTALDGAVRDIEAAKRQADEARAEAKKAGEEAAELRGRLAAAVAVPGKE
mgnify:CR=1 FL=1